ncbi:polyphosphate--glucose phosphotransferase [Actinomadura madurae]|uniref:polyphosphate--glucose phosphotransferase n=1 Tax=Actinomadura madurae TaxID=1993 RepID=UPI0027E352EB|nr:SMR family transporter [Actinomadura madurae]
MAWLFLLVAGLMELVWAAALKESDGMTRLWPTVIGLSVALLSVVVLSVSLRTLPVGTAYAVFVGLGAAAWRPSAWSRSGRARRPPGCCSSPSSWSAWPASSSRRALSPAGIGHSGGMAREMLGIDIGGSGIKGAPVDLSTGEFTRERFRVATPQPSRPKPVAKVLAEIVDHFGWDGPVGVTYPGVVIDGVALSAANVSKRWIGLDAASLIAKATGREITLLNDADAAGVAEMRLGAGRGRSGTVVLLTLGTGIGSALFTDGVLVPNTEFGHIQIKGKDAEVRASAKARTDRGLSWEQWARRLGTYMRHLEALISPP